jgi:hypothetical protein
MAKTDALGSVDSLRKAISSVPDSSQQRRALINYLAGKCKKRLSRLTPSEQPRVRQCQHLQCSARGTSL